MRLKRIRKFTASLTKGLLPSQQATLAQMVCGLLAGRSLLLAKIARGFETQVAFSHNLKRVERFVSNPRLHSLQSKQLLARRLLHQLHHRLQIKPREPLEIILDWTTVWPYQVLSALVPVSGRAVPILQWAIARDQLKAQQNTFEMQFLAALRQCLPKAWKVVIVADRGFQRVALLEYLDSLGFSYVIRLKGDACVEVGSYSGKLRDYPLTVGQCFKLSEVIYHKTKRYGLKVVINCERREGKVCSWLLATNLGMTARQTVKIYARRFWCEESFRDQKQEFKLEGVRVQQAARLENLLLVLGIVLMMLAVIGMRGNKLACAEKYRPRKKERGKPRVWLSWVQIALNLLRESSKFLDLLFESRATGFNFRWA
jgi:Transposase DDE domain